MDLAGRRGCRQKSSLSQPRNACPRIKVIGLAGRDVIELEVGEALTGVISTAETEKVNDDCC